MDSDERHSFSVFQLNSFNYARDTLNSEPKPTPISYKLEGTIIASISTGATRFHYIVARSFFYFLFLLKYFSKTLFCFRFTDKKEQFNESPQVTELSEKFIMIRVNVSIKFNNFKCFKKFSFSLFLEW